MLFWIFVIFLVLGIVLTIAISIYESNCSYLLRNVKNKKIFDFLRGINADLISAIASVITTISGFVIAIILLFIIPIYITAEGRREVNELKYATLLYKSQAENIRDEFGIVNKQYVDELQAWNEYLTEYRAYSDNFWIGIFTPNGL